MCIIRCTRFTRRAWAQERLGSSPAIIVREMDVHG
jgi:hypothetical protein